MLTHDTIAALSTAQGDAAIAVVRMSGMDSRAILGRVFRGPDPFACPRQMVLGKVLSGDRPVDSVLAVGFPGPASYTGEDVAEIHGHGGTFVASRVLETVLNAGARLADPGEFTRRAFLNGKMDLTQAEAVMDLIHAKTEAALRVAGEQLAGHLGRELGTVRDSILALVAHVEAWIDFPEEDIDPDTSTNLIARAGDLLARIDSLLSTADEGRILREGVRLVLCGAPNAGKSSLLNRLLGCDRAIVAPTPGTTRDTIEESANLHGVLFRITDTAGLRESTDPVEQLGIQRAREAIERADIVLHLVDASASDAPPAVASSRELVVLNKRDLLTVGDWTAGCLAISCKTGDGIEDLLKELVRRAGLHAKAPSAAAINARQHACLVRARQGVAESLEELLAGHAPEYAATGLHSALDAVGEVLGATDTEEILGTIFSTFCIGK